MDKINVLESAIYPLPASLRRAIKLLAPSILSEIEEIRMRIGHPLSVSIGGQERTVFDQFGKTIPVTTADLNFVMDIATRSSIHSAMDSMKNGFFTMQEGHRIGICGSAVMKDGAVSMIRSVSSLSIRVAKEYPGCSDSFFEHLFSETQFQNTLILSPPGLGKTTLLRDIVRNLSAKGIRTGIADERSELASMHEGRSRFDIGNHTDVIDGAPKRIGMLMLLKTMSPQVICADEITAPADVEAVEICANCGVSLLASVHAGSVEELYTRSVSRMLMERNVFRCAVVISREHGKRCYRIMELPR